MSMNQNIDVKKLLFIIVPLISIMIGMTLLQVYQFQRSREAEAFQFTYLNAPEGDYVEYIVPCDVSDNYIYAKHVNISYLNLMLGYLRGEPIDNPLIPILNDVDEIIQKYEDTFEFQLFFKYNAEFSFFRGKLELERSIINSTGLYCFNFTTNQYDETFLYSTYGLNSSGYMGGSIVISYNAIEYSLVDLENYLEWGGEGLDVEKSMIDYASLDEIRIVASFEECYYLHSKYFDAYIHELACLKPSEITNITSQTYITENKYNDFKIDGFYNLISQYDVSVFTLLNNSQVAYSNNAITRFINDSKINVSSKFVENTFNPYRLLNTSYGIYIFDAKPYMEWGYDFTNIGTNIIPFIVIAGLTISYSYYLTKKKEF